MTDNPRNWRSFPASYLSLLRRFQEKSGDIVVQFSKKGDAHLARRELYRIRKAIAKHAASLTDQEAVELSEAISRLTITIEPHGGPKEDPATMTLKDNPIWVAIDKAVGDI